MRTKRTIRTSRRTIRTNRAYHENADKACTSATISMIMTSKETMRTITTMPTQLQSSNLMMLQKGIDDASDTLHAHTAISVMQEIKKQGLLHDV